MKWTSFNVDTRRERVKLIPALLTISLCTTLRMVAFGQVAPVAVNWTGTVRGVGHR
jgi:hypothetical protein